MSWASTFALRLRGLFGQTRIERELDDEVRFHLDMQIEDNLSAGMNPAEARYAALRSFGAIEPMKENYRERSAFAFVETVAQDLRYALRTLRKNPSFTLTAVTTLAVAIGANTAMFSVLNAVLFRPLPFRSPEQLAMLWTETPDQRVREGRSAYLSVEQWRSQSQSFADIAFFDGVSSTLMSADKAQQISVVRVSPNFFPLLGVQPIHGRSFSTEEAETQQRLAVISHRFWQSRFGGSRDPIGDAIGSTIELDQRRSRIIGILPESFQLGGSGGDVWEPHTLYSDWETLRQRRGSGIWSVIGRLRPNVTFEQAQAEMNAIARRLDEQLPAAERNRGISVVPLSLQLTGAKARLALWMLTGAVLFVLLIAAFNVASLSLARAASREREIAVRAALGASRGRIIRQLLAESVTLAVIAGLLGLFVALASIRVILAMKPGDLIRLDEVSLDPQVLGSALALCLLTGILVGLAPAITMARRSLQPASQEGGRSIAGGIATRRIRRALVVSEFALAIVLLVGAGLLIRSLWSIQNVDPGFRREGVLSVSLAPPTSVATAQRANFYNQALEQVRSLPGVESAAITSELFIGGNPERAITVEDGALPAGERIRLRSDELSEEFFKTLGTPLLKGRFFSASDGRPDSPKVAIINDAMARRLWGERDPVGKRFTFGTDGAAVWFTVVGVVGDMRRQGLEIAPIPQMFEPIAQNPPRRVILLIRTSVDDPLKLAGSVQAAVGRVEKYTAVYGVNTLDNQLGGFLTQRRFQTFLLIGFSIAALLMAAIGIYGLIQYSIATRTHEIGIRMAVGAQAGEIFRMILGEGLKLCLIGLGLGLLGSLWLSRASSSLLFGVTAADPLTLLTVSLLLTVVALSACYFPARRATKVEPVIALRHE